MKPIATNYIFCLKFGTMRAINRRQYRRCLSLSRTARRGAAPPNVEGGGAPAFNVNVVPSLKNTKKETRRNVKLFFLTVVTRLRIFHSVSKLVGREARKTFSTLGEEGRPNRGPFLIFWTRTRGYTPIFAFRRTFLGTMRRTVNPLLKIRRSFTIYK